VAFRFAEARRWKAELDTIKANTELVIDQRRADGEADGQRPRIENVWCRRPTCWPDDAEALETVASDAWLTSQWAWSRAPTVKCSRAQER